MAKVLVFFTASYPFGKGETFIENEIKYLAESFDKVVIVSNNTVDAQTREVPSNVVLERKSYELERSEKIKAFFNVLSPLFRSELKIIKEVYCKKLTPPMFNTMVLSMQKMNVWNSYINRLLPKYTSMNDDVYLYSYWANDMALAVAEFDGSRVRKKITRAHGWDTYFEASEIGYLPFRKHILEKIGMQCFISNAGLNYYLELFPELKDKMTIKRLGVSALDKIADYAENVSLVVVSCSNVIPLKRVSLIAEALKMQNGRVEWHHFGDGYLFEELKSVASKCLDNSENISYTLHGRVPNSEYLDFLAKSKVDLFMNVSTTEGVPVSIMEAMSISIPCFATNVGGNSEIVNDKNGLLLPADLTPEYLAEKITWFNGLSEEEKKQMRESAYETWEEKYNAEKNYNEFIKLIFE